MGVFQTQTSDVLKTSEVWVGNVLSVPPPG